MLSNTVYLGEAKPKGTPLSDLTEGILIKINEDGSPVEFYLAKHNYEPDLNGQGRELVVRKDCFDQQAWNSAGINTYANSTMDSWLNNAYKNKLAANTLSLIVPTKIRYTYGNASSAMGTLERAVFLLSAYELGYSKSSFNNEGTTLPNVTIYQIAKLNGSVVTHWTRTPSTYSTSFTKYAAYIETGGSASLDSCIDIHGSRPCFTLPATALVDPDLNLMES